MILGLLLGALTAAPSVGIAPRDTTTACAVDLDRLDAKIRQNYPGFVLEAVGATLRRYEATRVALRQRAKLATGDDCYPILAALTDFFHDPHLFVYQSARLDTAETTRRAAAVERRALDETAARRYLRASAARLDPIEGIWYDRGLRVAIVASPAGQRKTFVAVVLAADTSTWTPGAVRARITRRAAGRYDVDLAERNYALRHLNGTLHRKVLLRLSPGIWGKAFPVAAADSGTIDPVDPHRPVLLERDGAVEIAIPSHDPAYRAAFDSLIQAHRDALIATRTLVIDLRGNEGGSSGMTASLRPFYLTSEDRAPEEGWEGGMLSSPDQISYALRTIAPDTTKADDRYFITRMRQHVGEFVPFFDSLYPPPPPPAPTVPAPGNRVVGMLIDHGTVSASEAMLLEAKRSPRVTVYGEESAGAIEYQSVSIVPFQANDKRWYLGYPTITAHIHRSPTIARHGVIPDVAIDLATTVDPVGAVITKLGTLPR